MSRHVQVVCWEEGRAVCCHTPLLNVCRTDTPQHLPVVVGLGCRALHPGNVCAHDVVLTEL